jgi:hypothetical protein
MPWNLLPQPMVCRTPSHGIANPLLWYYEHPIHGISNPYPWYFDPLTYGILLWYYEPTVQHTMG